MCNEDTAHVDLVMRIEPHWEDQAMHELAVDSQREYLHVQQTKVPTR